MERETIRVFGVTLFLDEHLDFPVKKEEKEKERFGNLLIPFHSRLFDEADLCHFAVDLDSHEDGMMQSDECETSSDSEYECESLKTESPVEEYLMPTYGIKERQTKSNWKGNFQKLVDFKKRHHTLVIPSHHPLYNWVSRQRSYKKKGILTKYHEKKLCELGVKLSGPRNTF